MGDETETLVADPGTQKNLGETRGFGSGSRDAADSLNRESKTALLHHCYAWGSALDMNLAHQHEEG